MDGFKRPARPRQVGQVVKPPIGAAAPPQQAKPVAKESVESSDLPTIDLPKDISLDNRPKSSKTRRKIAWAVIAGLILMVACLASLASYMLGPKDSSATQDVPVEIVSGMMPGDIASMLEDSGVIRSALAFSIYARLSGAQNSLQAGSYQLSPADSTPEIASQLQKGPLVDEIEVMFKPGATLADNKKVLIDLGYTEAEVNEAFNFRYDHPLFVDRPATSDLEGYVYGETHRFVVGTSVKDILGRYFDDYYTAIEQGDLISKYKAQGLSLFEGITLASIVQRESGGDDKAQIAQVFLKRLNEGMELGSDVTYQYIADKEGQPRDINYDSPYNTRRYAGLPPGPIASPGKASLEAVGSPASGDYLYFLSGDDGVTYFGRTLSEHEANIRNHCTEKCQII